LNNQKRLEEAKKIYDGFDWTLFERVDFSDLVIGVIASNRGGNYLFQSITFLLNQLENKEKIPFIGICNVEPVSFPQVEKFRNKIPIYSINSFKDLSRFNLSTLEGRVQKEAADYWSCLRVLTTFNKKYLLLLEDDAVVIPHFLTLMDSLMSRLDDPGLEHVDYVKLFHPWYLRKIPFIFQAASFSLIVSTFLFYIVFKKIAIRFILVLAISCYINLKFLNYEIFADLRYHITSLPYLVPSESCCTPAVLFRGNSALEMIQELPSIETTKNHAKDHVLDESRFIGKETDFSYVVHIGHFSSIRHKEVPLEALRKHNL